MAVAAKKKTRTRANSKSGAVRAYMKGHPDAGPTAISSALKKKGIDISPAHVSNVKAAMKKSGGGASSNGVAHGKRGRRGRKRAAGDAVSLSQLMDARKFADAMGGVEHAQSLLASLARLS